MSLISRFPETTCWLSQFFSFVEFPVFKLRWSSSFHVFAVSLYPHTLVHAAPPPGDWWHHETLVSALHNQEPCLFLSHSNKIAGWAGCLQNLIGKCISNKLAHSARVAFDPFSYRGWDCIHLKFNKTGNSMKCENSMKIKKLLFLEIWKSRKLEKPNHKVFLELLFPYSGNHQS